MTLFQEAISVRGHDDVARAAGKIADRVGSEDAYRGSGAYRSTEAQDRMINAFGAKREPARGGGPTKRAGRGLVRRRSKRW